MTRFQIVGIFEDKILIAGEFNGDGYFEGGHGEEVCSSFKEITDETGFKDLAESINEQHFGYNEQIVFETDIDYALSEHLLDFKYLEVHNLYYETWFSDYLYIKNFTNEEWEITDREGTVIKVGPQGWVTLTFGKLYKQNFERNMNISTAKCSFNIIIKGDKQHE